MDDKGSLSQLVLVLSTEVDQNHAEALASALLERRLVACVSLYPVQSHYRWQGKLEKSSEVQLLIKTTPDRLDALLVAMNELHSYDTPELIHWRASASAAYGDWAVEAVASQDF